MLTPNQLRYGKIESLPQPILLHAGLVSLVYDEGDLRYIKCGDHELVRRIYAAVRDRNWGTIPPVFTNVCMDIKDDRFCIVYEVVNQADDIHKNMRAGDCRLQAAGEARSSFIWIVDR